MTLLAGVTLQSIPRKGAQADANGSQNDDKSIASRDGEKSCTSRDGKKSIASRDGEKPSASGDGEKSCTSRDGEKSSASRDGEKSSASGDDGKPTEDIAIQVGMAMNCEPQAEKEDGREEDACCSRCKMLAAITKEDSTSTIRSGFLSRGLEDITHVNLKPMTKEEVAKLTDDEVKEIFSRGPMAKSNFAGRLSKDEEMSLKRLLLTHRDRFAMNTKDPGLANFEGVKIDTGNAQPFAYPMRSVLPK